MYALTSESITWVKCGDVIDVRDGTHDTPTAVPVGIPLVTSKNLTRNGVDLQNVTFISAEDHRKIGLRSGVERGDILFAMIGTIGNPVIIEGDANFSIKNVALFKFNGSVVHNRYFKHLLQSGLIKRQLNELTRGGNQKFVSLGALRSLKLPLLPLPEQKRIAELLDTAEAIRRKREQTIDLVNVFHRSLFLDMFGDPAGNPMGWPVRSINDVVELTQYGTAEKATRETSDTPVIRMNNITYDGGWKLDDLKYMASATPHYLLRPRDLLFNRTNSQELVGKAAVWVQRGRFAFAGYLIRVRFKEDTLSPFYAAGYLNSAYGKRLLLSVAQPSINMSNISASTFRRLPIPVPPLTLQESYENISSRSDSHREHLLIAAEQDHRLFESLTHQAFGTQ